MDAEHHFRILATVALADRVLGDDERDVLLRCSQWLGIPRARAGEILREVRSSGGSLAAPPAVPADRLKAFRNVLIVALADGRVTEAEAECLRRLARAFAIPANEARRLLAEVSMSWKVASLAHSPSSQVIADVHETLDSHAAPTASDQRGVRYLAPGAPPAPGSVVGGKFRLLERLGEGGFGVVFRARHQDLGEDVALKVLLAEAVARNSDAERRFLQEARLTRAFAHRYAVALREFGRDPIFGLYFTMDLVQGRPLGDVLEREGPLPVARAVRLGTQALEALEEAHRVGIVHRDLKPSNLMVTTGPTGEEEVRVLDFGVAKAISAIAGGDAKLTTEGQLVGTPTYMSPEQASGRALDGRSDVYSLAVVLYEAVCGCLPYAVDPDSDDFLQAILFQIVVGTARDPAAVSESVPRPVADVLLRALAKEREARFPDARSFREALVACVSERRARP